MIQTIMPPITSSFVTGLVLLLYRQVVAGAPPVWFLAGGLAVSYATTAAVMALLPNGRATLTQSLADARRVLLHRS